MKVAGFEDEYKKLAERLYSLTTEWEHAGWWRSYEICQEMAEIMWQRMPMIYSALIHHSEGMRAQRQLTACQRPEGT